MKEKPKKIQTKLKSFFSNIKVHTYGLPLRWHFGINAHQKNIPQWTVHYIVAYSCQIISEIYLPSGANPKWVFSSKMYIWICWVVEVAIWDIPYYRFMMYCLSSGITAIVFKSHSTLKVRGTILSPHTWPFFHQELDVHKDMANFFESNHSLFWHTFIISWKVGCDSDITALRDCGTCMVISTADFH